MFRNIILSFIGIIQILWPPFILGIGLMEIPLDMMTITIAAITIGIAVDVLFIIFIDLREFKKIKKYNKTQIDVIVL